VTAGATATRAVARRRPLSSRRKVGTYAASSSGSASSDGRDYDDARSAFKTPLTDGERVQIFNANAREIYKLG
jgi:hypothetical protein